MKKIVLAIALLAISACTPGHLAANKNPAVWVWVGCHIVKSNPGKGNTYAIGPGYDLKVGDKFYYKQVGHDGTVGPVVTGVPCKVNKPKTGVSGH